MSAPAPQPPPPKHRAGRELKDRLVRVGWERKPFQDIYHFFLTISWPRLFLLLFGMYIAMNVIFAAGYYFDEGGLENARQGSYLDSFFFSVQTMATIGYGKMTPRSVFANVLVTIEALIGLLAMAMATGLMFAKFSRPTARVRFSRWMVVALHNGVPTLMVRMANARGNQIVEAQLRLVMLRNEVTSEGERVRRIVDLPLQRERTPVFAVSWTVMHAILPGSPLYGMTAEKLEADGVELMAALIGTDETFAQTVHARATYFADEIAWGYRFADMLHRSPDGQVILDYNHFDELVAEVAAASPAA